MACLALAEYVRSSTGVLPCTGWYDRVRSQFLQRGKFGLVRAVVRSKCEIIAPIGRSVEHGIGHLSRSITSHLARRKGRDENDKIG